MSLFLMQGVELPDPEGVLEGSGKLLRHLKLRSRRRRCWSGSVLASASSGATAIQPT